MILTMTTYNKYVYTYYAFVAKDIERSIQKDEKNSYHKTIKQKKAYVIAEINSIL